MVAQLSAFGLKLLSFCIVTMQDGQMSYKQALAFWATGDVQHAQTAVKIIDSWAGKNSKFGLADQNGPLEAAWVS